MENKIKMILGEVEKNFVIREYGSREYLDGLMKSLDKYKDSIIFGLEEDKTGLFIEVIKLEEE